MKKLLLVLLAACGSFVSTNAQQDTHIIPVKSVTYMDASQVKPLSGHQALATKKNAPARKEKSLITPKGQLEWYTMSCAIRDFTDGFLPVLNVAEKVYFAEDGKTVYLGSLFPGKFYCDDIWFEAKLNNTGDKLEFDINKPIIEVEVYEEDGTRRIATLQFGEMLEDDFGNTYGFQPFYLNVKDGESFYPDYSEIAMHSIVLFEVSGDAAIIYDTVHNPQLTPYTGNTELVKVPASAKIEDYIYTMQDAYGKEFAIKGQVAIDGNDYYFDSLIPDATERGQKWIKGTRSGNTIKLANNQFLGSDISYFLYYNGFKASGGRGSNGDYKGSITEVSFNVDAEGRITLNNPDSTFPCAFYTSGNQFQAWFFRHRIEPFKGDAQARPANITDLTLNLNFIKYGEASVEFNVDNMSMDGDYLDPAKLSYCIYIDEDTYTFTKKYHPFLAWESITNIPLNYNDGTEDSASNSIWILDDNHHVVCFYEVVFNKVGVQMIYTLDGKEYRSGITYIDRNKAITVEDPEGIHAVSLGEDRNGCTYDLSGRKVSNLGRGLYINGSKLILR